jgi:hypothetical protein
MTDKLLSASEYVQQWRGIKVYSQGEWRNEKFQ